MLTLIFVILMFSVFGKLLLFSIKAAWGITKIVFTIVLLPLVLIGMALAGLMYGALILVVIIGAVSLFASRA
mgnify:CR=1 FL=1